MSIQLDTRRAAGLVELAHAATTSLAGERSFREIIDRLPAAIYTTDAEGRLTHYNRACVDFSGRTPELGTDHWCVTWKLYYPDGRPMPHADCPMAVALKEGREVRGEQAIAERPDGTRIWFEPYPIPLRDDRGAIVGGVNMLVDITDIKEAQAERGELLAREREARREAEALNEVARAVAGLDLEAVVQKATDAATELTGAKFGAFFYNVINEHGEAFLLYTLSGAPREAFEKLGLPRNTAVFGPTFRGEGIVRIADVLADPRYGKNSPHKGMPPGHLPVRSYLAVPVVASSGEVLGGLFFGHPETGVFTDQAERVAAGIALHAGIAMDNARLFEDAQQEIAERKKIEDQLRRNTEELARFNQVAVGRELRMIELKKEINELRDRLGHAPRYPLQFDKGAGATNE
ncbi:MAG TPA: GAF domain-containing protein [Woeseiaceae bacterium]|nr:GAF domain-containing protein [Woeseiaceae bacterium]